MEQELQLKHVPIYLKVQELKVKNIIMCDSKGVIFKGRKNIDQFKSAHAIDTKFRTLSEAIKDADVFLAYQLKMLFQKKW